MSEQAEAQVRVVGARCEKCGDIVENVYRGPFPYEQEAKELRSREQKCIACGGRVLIATEPAEARALGARGTA